MAGNGLMWPEMAGKERDKYIYMIFFFLQMKKFAPKKMLQKGSEKGMFGKTYGPKTK